MKSDYSRSLYKEYELVLSEKEKLEAEHRALRIEYQLMQKELLRLREKETELLEKTARMENEKIELTRENLRLKALLNTDGTNSGLPTSRTPLNKRKVIPNTREKTGRHIGGQKGHPKRKLEAFAEEEITEKEIHVPECCPYCGSHEIEETGKSITKDELDYEIVVVKKRHHYPECTCSKCGRNFRREIPSHLKEENQYGPNVQVLALALMNVGNVSINKTRKMIYGFSEEEINPSEGYIAKLEKRAAKVLEPFLDGLKKRCQQLGTVYWDDTVIAVNTRRACLRFYGDEKTALYKAHLHKDKKGIDEDGILQSLSKETVVMHDHNKVNYNEDYGFTNVECNVHLLRDLQKTTDNLGHEWSCDLKQLLVETNAARNKAIEEGKEEFTDEYIKKFFEEYDRIMLLALDENRKDYNRYYGKDEQTLILRIAAYKENYLAWVTNFDLPFSNNLSERALRGVKSKMKIAGQFQSEESAGWYAAIKSYTETCMRNGINEIDALSRLCRGKPYTIAEIYAQQNDE